MTGAEYKQPCKEHVELRVKTEKELALIGQAMNNHVSALQASSVAMAECTIQMEEQIKLLTDGRIELARQDERLKAGNKRFGSHLAMIVGLGTMLFGVVLFIVGTHGVDAIKNLGF